LVKKQDNLLFTQPSWIRALEKNEFIFLMLLSYLSCAAGLEMIDICLYWGH
jgi:hypothetical protein